LLETLESGDDQILYRTRDLVRCWQCGYEGNAPDEAYCAQCGVALDRKEEARLLEVRDIEASGPPGEAVIERFTSEGRSFLRLAAMAAESVPGRGEAEPAQREDGGVRLWAGQRSDTGQVRELNEDSLVVLVAVPTWESNTGPVLGLFAVADGMGGHEGGEVASKLALRVVAGEVLRRIFEKELAGETLPEQALTANLGAAAVAANDAVYLERHKRENDMGTTLTVALLRDDQVHLAHVGDSRAYRWSAAGLEQLTTDHSMVASLIASGRAEPDEVYTHPQRSVIYRSIGDRPQVEVDTATLPLATGDRLILCSDGLWEMIRDEGIADVMMLEANPQAACDLMVQRANLAGGDDNISVVVVQVEAGQMSK
jgi:serine/threonine protein phosphatase PrpC